MVENSTFLKYHEILRNNPSSIVFAPLAEMLIIHKCYEEAIIVCKKGLEKNPDLVSGRIALARAYVGVGNYKRAAEEAGCVLSKYPNHPEAMSIISAANLNRERKDEHFKPLSPRPVESHLEPSSLDPTADERWNTPTMAEILASQGNIETARKIYNGILKNDPTNQRAAEGLKKLYGSTE